MPNRSGFSHDRLELRADDHREHADDEPAELAMAQRGVGIVRLGRRDVRRRGALEHESQDSGNAGMRECGNAGMRGCGDAGMRKLTVWVRRGKAGCWAPAV